VTGREFKTSPEDTFTQVQFDWRSKLVATASTGGTIDVSISSAMQKKLCRC
jgi:hypothetical protein